MVWLKHIGCKTPIYEYIGERILRDTHRSACWRFADGTHPRSGSRDRAYCPDCGASVFPDLKTLSTVDGSPFWRFEMASKDPFENIFGGLVSEETFERLERETEAAILLENAERQSKTLWGRFKALFSF